MDFEEIKQILALVKEHELAEFELAHQDFKIRIRKDTVVQTLVAAPLPIAAVAPASAPAAPAAAAPVPPAVEDGDELAVLCIIEAMKLMNEIESEYDGEIVKAYVENGQPVQFGERLFAIKAQ